MRIEALNRGADWARREGRAWMLVFDQDSTPLPGLAGGLWAAHLRQPAAAVIGPVLLESGSGGRNYRYVCRHRCWPWLFRRVPCGNSDLADVTMLITSGSMIDLDVWSRLGGFDEDLFIDYVDVDFCLRVRRLGRSIAVAASARLQHRLGARKQGQLLGWDFRPTHHAAFRHYFIARNRIRLWRAHAVQEPHWALFDFSYAVYNALRVVVFEEVKWTKLEAMILGTWDGLRGRSGPCPEQRMRALRS